MELSIVSIFYINRMNHVQFLFLAVTIKSLQFQDDYYMKQELKEKLYKKKSKKKKTLFKYIWFWNAIEKLNNNTIQKNSNVEIF